MSRTPASPPVSGVSSAVSVSPLWSQALWDPGSWDHVCGYPGVTVAPLIASPWATSPSPVGVSDFSNTHETDSLY